MSHLLFNGIQLIWKQNIFSILLSLQSLESADVQLNEDTDDEEDTTDVIQTIEIPSSQVRFVLLFE